jgi:diguanylate cyclase
MPLDARNAAMDPLLLRLSDTVADAQTLEELTRPLIEMLEAVTGLESTYLTTIDLEAGRQHVLYARNSPARALTIPEGLDVPWSDTLCKRALDEHRPYTANVDECWGDSGAARDLGIRTYVSTPVRLADGELYGTLCAASGASVPLPANAERVLRLFSRLIAQHVVRERLVEQLREANAELAASALTDALTGLPNRRALYGELARLLAWGEREQGPVLVGVIDLDGFKALNDTHGHEAGDRFLQAVAQCLSEVLRKGDMLARLGGDEFVVLGAGPFAGESPEQAARGWQQRLQAASTRCFDLPGGPRIDYGGASVGIVAIGPGEADADQALRRADAAMYEVKRERRAPR